jgi:endonuclease/exonuclease/phosphatase (EEP) superfamily protein YafD
VYDGAEVLFTAMYPRSPRNYTYWKQSIASVRVDAEVIRRWREGRQPGSPPLIVAGDFNTTPMGRTHSIMRTSGLCAWSPELGAGTFPSWASRWLALPLDRSWFTDDVLVGDWKVGPRLKSDHRPIVLDLYVKR